MDFSDDNYMFQCPACRQHISDSQIHDHIQSCEFYFQHSSNSISYSSMHSSFDISYNYNRNSATSSDSESHEGLPDFSILQKPTIPSKTQSIAICPVCFEHFHNTRNTPLLLPICGHTVCKPCLKEMREKFSYMSCPICRAVSKVEIKNLPLNYALLELAWSSKCIVHELELVAYCQDCDKILCGACVLEHKSHSVCLLTDPILSPLFETKRSSMTSDLEDLKTMRKAWTIQKLEMEKLNTKIKENIEVHRSNIQDTEKKMIKNIKEGSEFCILKLSEIQNSDTIKKIENEIRGKLSLIEKNLALVEEKLERFDDLNVVERLKNESIDKEKYRQVPELDQALNLNDKLMVKIDYCAAIQNRNLGL